MNMFREIAFTQFVEKKCLEFCVIFLIADSRKNTQTSLAYRFQRV